MRISVVIPTYNRQHTILNAVRSVMEQTMPVAEIIVTDDGSTDDTIRIVHEAFPSVRIVRLDRNSGAQAARAVGIQVATSEWVAFLDSDDRWLPHKLEVQLAKVNEGFPVIHGPGLILRNGREEFFTIPPLEGQVYESLLRGPGPLYQCLLVRRECFTQAGLPDPGIVAYQEWDMSLALARHYPFGYVDTPLFVYEVHQDSISKDGARGIRGYEQIVRKWWPEIVTVAGSDAGYAHYSTLKALAFEAGDFKKAISFIVEGARLTNQSSVRCLRRELVPHCRGWLWEKFVALGKHIPGLQRAYRELKSLGSHRD